MGLVLAGGARSGLAVGLFVLKLSLLLAVATIGLRTTLLAPMSFAVGATTLLLAIVLDTCYGNRPATRPKLGHFRKVSHGTPGNLDRD